MRKPPRRSLFTASVYGGVIVLLLLLAFFTRGFSQSLGDARISGRYALLPLFQTRVLNDLTVSWNGMSLHFSRRTSPALLGIEEGDSGMDILFADDARLRLSADAGTAGSLSLSAAAPSTGSAGAALLIPYTLTGVPLDSPADSALSWKRAGRLFFLNLPTGAQADAEMRVLTLPLRPGAGAATLRVAGAEVATAPAHPVAARAASRAVKLPDEKLMPTVEQLQDTLGRFVDAAYLGWTQDRYSPSTGQWKMADGSLGFSAEIGVPLIAESITRGAWQRVLPLWSGAETMQERRGGAAPDPTSGYVGGVREYVHALAARQAADLERARGLLAKTDPSLLAVPGLVPLLMGGGGNGDTQAAVTWLVSLNTSSLDIGSCLALLEDLVDYGEAARVDEAVSRALRALIAGRILPSVVTVESAVFLLTDAAGHSDMRAGVRCGSLLMRAGALLKDPLASAVGRGLTASALALADADGILPATLTIASGRIGAREGALAPESLYALLPLERSLPRRVSLSAVGPEAWVWTPARVASAEGSAEDAKITFSYPPGVPYHLAIVGVKSFRLLRLHGIPWHSDPDYAKYSDGWAYEPATRTLFMKITGRSGQEEIGLHY
jgi:hypothetical protein